MRTTTALFLAALLGPATASAQTTFKLGLRGGLNRATTTLDASSTSAGNARFNYSAEKLAVNAGQVGAVLDIAFSKFAIQPALLFSQKGERFNTTTSVTGVRGNSTEETQRTSRSNWLELPVNFVYPVRGFQLFAGPYLAVAVGGRQQGVTYQASPEARYAPRPFDEKISYGPYANRRLDAGVNFGMGYRTGPVQVQLGYGLGLLNLRRDPIDLVCVYDWYDFDADPAYNRVVQLTGTYFFDL